MTSGASQMRLNGKVLQVYDSDLSRTSLWSKLSELVAYRYLLRNLVVRDIKARYKNSVLGILWSMLNPLGLMVVFTILFTVLSRDDAQRQFPVFVLVGLMPWNFFNGAVSSGTVSVITHSRLIKKVYFPRELLPMSALLSNFVNFLMTFVVLIVFLYVFDIGLTVHALWVPALLLAQLIFTLGMTLFLSAAAVFYGDVLMVMEVLMLAWFFLTPIFYPLEQFGDSATVLGVTFVPAQVMRWVNPMASIIDGYRTVLWGTVSSNGPVGMDLVFMLRTFFTAVVVLILGYVTFSRTEHLFGERL